MSLPTTGLGAGGGVLSVEESEKVEGALQTGVVQCRLFRLAVDVSTSSTTWADLLTIPFVALGGDPPLPRLNVTVRASVKGDGGGGLARQVSFTTAIDRLQAGSVQQGLQANSCRVSALGEQTVSNSNEYSNINTGTHDVIVRWKVSAGSAAINASSDPDVASLTVVIKEVVF
jgi:hypothetical protein